MARPRSSEAKFDAFDGCGYAASLVPQMNFCSPPLFKI
jgi:hypothetical protein